MQLSKRLNNFPEYPFAKYQRKIKEIEQKTGKKVLSFGIGSPDIRPSQKYINKLKEYIAEKNSHQYPGFNAIDKLQKAITKWYQTRFQIKLTKEQIAPLLGAKDGVSHINLALLDQNDEVLIPNPGYPAYTGAALLVNAKPIYYNLIQSSEFPIDISELKSKLNKNTKFIWINFPSNPTGQTIKTDGLKRLVQFAIDNQIWLIYDNAYSEITFENYQAPSILQIKNAAKVAIELQSFSKTFSFAGFRMGWATGNAELIQALMKVKSQTDSGLSRPLQLLGAYSLNNFDKNWYKAAIEEYKKRRDIIIKKLKKLNMKFIIPKGSLYIWAQIPEKYKNSETFSIEMLEKHQVFFTPGTAFGSNGKKYVRISICVDISQINDYL